MPSITDWQSPAALGIVALTAAIFAFRVWRRRRSTNGCGGGCGCGTREVPSQRQPRS